MPAPSTASSIERAPAEAPGPLIPFEFLTSTRIISGPGSINRLGEVAREYGKMNVLLVTDPGLEAAGHPQKATKALHTAGFEVHVFDEVDENPSGRHVELGVRFARKLNIDLIVAVGGGSAMDCAKGINFLLTNGGTIADYKGFGKARKPMLPSVGIPTTSGTGSEAQSYALLADERTQMKMACGDRKAAFRVAILDPEVTLSQPAKVTALTGIDALSHALESYVSNSRSTLSQMYARTAWKLLIDNFEKVVQSPHNLEARAAMQFGAYLAGVAIENSMLGVCHACANPLTAHYGITHGLAIGVMMPHVIRFNGEHVGASYCELAQDAGLACDSPAAAVEAIAQRMSGFLQLTGFPTNFDSCGISSGILWVLAEEASQQWTAKFNPRPVNESNILELYKSAM